MIEMRIRATCKACDRDFLFFELRHAESWAADRCPHCGRILGVPGLLAVRAEQALAVLIRSLEDLSRHHPNFTVHHGSVLGPVEEAVAPLADLPATKVDALRGRRWWQRSRAAA